LESQTKNSFLHRGRTGAAAKLIIAALALTIPPLIGFSPAPTLALIIALALVQLAIGLKRTVTVLAVLWTISTAIIYATRAAFGLYDASFAFRLLHGLATAYTATLLWATTPPKQLKRLGALYTAYLSFRSALWDVKNSLDNLYARGWTPSLNPLNYVRPLTSVIGLMLYRISELEDSLLSRGAE